MWAGLKQMMPWFSKEDMEIGGCEEKHSSAATGRGCRWSQAAVAVVATSTASTAGHTNSSPPCRRDRGGDLVCTYDAGVVAVNAVPLHRADLSGGRELG